MHGGTGRVDAGAHHAPWSGAGQAPVVDDLAAVHEKHNLASPSPVTDGERVYAWFATGQIAALDTAGKLVWKKNLGTEYGPFAINWGHGSSPVVYKDGLILVCYLPSGAYLLGLDSASGSVRWKVDRPQPLARGWAP